MYTNLDPSRLRELQTRASELRLSAKAQQRLSWLLFYVDHQYSVGETCRAFGVQPMMFYRLLRRFDLADPSTLEDRSRRPHTVRSAWNTQRASVAPVVVQVHTTSAGVQVSSGAPMDIVSEVPTPSFPNTHKRALVLASALLNVALLGSLLWSAIGEGRHVSASITPTSTAISLPLE